MLMSTPAITKWYAIVCLSTWGVIFFPQFRYAGRTTFNESIDTEPGVRASVPAEAVSLQPAPLPAPPTRFDVRPKGIDVSFRPSRAGLQEHGGRPPTPRAFSCVASETRAPVLYKNCRSAYSVRVVSCGPALQHDGQISDWLWRRLFRLNGPDMTAPSDMNRIAAPYEACKRADSQLSDAGRGATSVFLQMSGQVTGFLELGANERQKQLKSIPVAVLARLPRNVLLGCGEKRSRRRPLAIRCHRGRGRDKSIGSSRCTSAPCLYQALAGVWRSCDVEGTEIVLP